MPAESFQPEIARFVMPFPVCLECGNALRLDEKTYADYAGQVTCSQCKERLNIWVVGGSLRQCTAAIESDLRVPDDYKYVQNVPAYWRAYEEALKCLAGNAPKACVTMCRLALEHALVEHGARVGDELSQMINFAKSKGLIEGRYKHLVETVRFFGGKGAHAQLDHELDVQRPEAIAGARVTKELLMMLHPVDDSPRRTIPFPAPEIE